MKRKSKRLIGVMTERAYCEQHGTYLNTAIFFGPNVLRSGCVLCKKALLKKRRARPHAEAA